MIVNYPSVNISNTVHQQSVCWPPILTLLLKDSLHSKLQPSCLFTYKMWFLRCTRKQKIWCWTEICIPEQGVCLWRYTLSVSVLLYRDFPIEMNYDIIAWHIQGSLNALNCGNKVCDVTKLNWWNNWKLLTIKLQQWVQGAKYHNISRGTTKLMWLNPMADDGLGPIYHTTYIDLKWKVIMNNLWICYYVWWTINSTLVTFSITCPSSNRLISQSMLLT